MLPAYYPVIAHGSLDDLYKCLDRCEHIIEMDDKWPGKHYAGYARTAKIWIPGYKARIQELRALGEKTIMETIAECTGNVFVCLESNAPYSPRSIKYSWPT